MDPIKTQNPTPEILNPLSSSPEVINAPKSPESFPSVESKVVDPVAQAISKNDDPLIEETKALTDLNQVLPIKPKTLAAANPDNGAESLGVDALNKATK
jgi:hypothetical protein